MVFGLISQGLAAPLIKMLAALLTAALPVRVTTSSGESVRGQWVAVTETAVQIESDGEIRSLPIDQLVTMEPDDAEERSGPTFRVTLLSGSKIAADEVSLDADKLVIEPRRQLPLRVNVKEVKSIRFQPADAKTNSQWLGLLEKQGRGDLMAIRREGERLDSYRGVINAIESGKVSFDLDNTPVDAPIEKLEGVIFGGNRRVNEQAPIRITDAYGSSWLATAILPGEATNVIKIELPGSLRHQIPLDQILSVRWSSGLQLLTELEAADQSYEGFFENRIDAPRLNKWFGPAADGEDLVMHARSSIEHRVEPGFTTLAGTVERAEPVKQAGQVVVSIVIDGKVRWKETLTEPKRLGFELPVADARRVRIAVDWGDDGDLGDTVRIIRPRLVK